MKQQNNYWSKHFTVKNFVWVTLLVMAMTTIPLYGMEVTFLNDLKVSKSYKDANSKQKSQINRLPAYFFDFEEISHFFDCDGISHDGISVDNLEKYTNECNFFFSKKKTNEIINKTNKNQDDKLKDLFSDINTIPKEIQSKIFVKALSRVKCTIARKFI